MPFFEKRMRSELVDQHRIEFITSQVCKQVKDLGEELSLAEKGLVSDVMIETIREAIEHLLIDPYDDIHDLHHHMRVWDNAQELVRSLSKKDIFFIEIDSLAVAVFWHDVALGKKVTLDKRDVHTEEVIEYLNDKLNSKLSKEKLESIVNAIRYHDEMEGRDNPKDLLEMILYDSDKIDLFHIERYRGVLKKYKKLSLLAKIIRPFFDSKLKKYAEDAAKRLIATRDALYLEKSKELYDAVIEQFLNDQEALRFANRLGFDVKKIASEMK